MKRPILVILLVVVLALAGVLFWVSSGSPARLSVEAATGTRPQITAPRPERLPTVNIAEPVGWDGGKPVAAGGLQVNAFASGLDHPRWMHVLPNGDVLVAETNSPPRPKEGVTDYVMGWLMSSAGAGSPSANRITLLRDADGDGVAEQRSALLTGLDSPFGMALVGDRLFVANHDEVVVYPFAQGQTRITEKARRVVRLPPGGNHWTRGLVASPDGTKLYVAVGSASNIGERGLDKEINRAAIHEIDIATGDNRVFASGLRNPVGLAYEPASNCLWTTVNERDMLGGDLVPDYMTCVQFGADYGWPHSYWGGYEDRRVEPRRPDRLEYVRRPDFALGPHVAALGLAFGDGARLGSNFANGAFVGLHGSWNRTPPSGYKVVFVPFAANGMPAADARPVDFLMGFLTENGKARGRPVGIAKDGTGALLVADDVGNVIWRVSAGARTAAR